MQKISVGPHSFAEHSSAFASMPIHSPVQINPLDAAAFEALDYRVMGHAYASQNELGRLCEECAYQADLKARLQAGGFRSALTEVPVTVTHRDFAKSYYLDLVADDAVYELKTDTSLVSEHDAQLLNYMFLLGIPRGKLLNFRPAKVQGKILATGLTPESRRRLVIAAECFEGKGMNGKGISFSEDAFCIPLPFIPLPDLA